MLVRKTVAILLLLVLCLPGIAIAQSYPPLPMDNLSPGPAPKDENYLSNRAYKDDTISVRIEEGRYAETDYVCAYVKIAHPSQLRTAPAGVAYYPQAAFTYNPTESSAKGKHAAKAVNAVVAINGDYCTKTDLAKVVLRQGKQVRNITIGISDLLIIDKEGNFSYLPTPSLQEYNAFYEANKQALYQVFCFGPVLVKDGMSCIGEDYENFSIGAHKNAQRTAIAQLGPLEYLLVTCYSNQMPNNKGMTIYEFAALCEKLGKAETENGCLLAYNLDGGNSSTLVFKDKHPETGKLTYVKVNCPDIERELGDILYFATLEK